MKPNKCNERRHFRDTQICRIFFCEFNFIQAIQDNTNYFQGRKGSDQYLIARDTEIIIILGISL